VIINALTFLGKLCCQTYNIKARSLGLHLVHSTAGRCTSAHCTKHYSAPPAWACHLHSAGHMPNQQPWFKYDALHHGRALQERVYHGRKFDDVIQLKQAIVLEWARTATALHWSQQWWMETSYAVCCGSEW